jgi:formylglycine-generating enzyme
MIALGRTGAGLVFWLALLSVGGGLGLPSLHAADPVVSNVQSVQRAGTQLVDITYDVADADGDKLTVSVAVSDTGGATATVPATSFTGDVGPNVSPGAGKRIVWDAGKDWPGKFSSNMRFRVTADDAATLPAPSGMALIPAGSFTMGDSLDGDSSALPLHSVYVSAFYMDKIDVTKALWDNVYQWATNHGYRFENGAQGKANNHPAHSMTWYDAVKWCNARSEKEGKTPCYYTGASQTAVYRSGQVDLNNSFVKWNAGYRLPTEAEWEKAARGGLNGHRFPWGDTIDWNRANYTAAPGSYAYDINPTGGYDPAFNDGVYPYTSPVDHFVPNSHGLYDMAGNVWQWCWDWYGSYSSASQTDPLGASLGSGRVLRGGGWVSFGIFCRAAIRVFYDPGRGIFVIGFRSVLPPGQ